MSVSVKWKNRKREENRENILFSFNGGVWNG